MKNSVNLNDLSQIEILSDEQTINIMGGTGTLTAETRSTSTPGGSYPKIIPGSTPQSPKDEEPQPRIVFFTL